MKKTLIIEVVIAMAFILFWLYAAGSKLYDLNVFRQEMNNQVFSKGISEFLVYALPATEVIIGGLLVYSITRLAGFILSLLLMLIFTIYIGLALLNVYSRMPCNCAGILGQNSSWETNFIFNLFATAVAAAGLILIIKGRERRKKGMDSIVSHAPLTT